MWSPTTATSEKPRVQRGVGPLGAISRKWPANTSCSPVQHAGQKSRRRQALILPPPPPPLPSRLLRALIGLKRVIINAAHFLVMKNKEFYRFYQTEPFLETVRRSRAGSVLPPASLVFSGRWTTFVLLFCAGRQASHTRISASAHFDRAGPGRTEVSSARPRISPSSCTSSHLQHILCLAGTWSCSTL